MAESDQKAYVTSNAVADGAKARQVNEKTLFEDGRQGIIEVGSLGKSPQFLNDFRSLRRKTEEIGNNPEPLLYAILKG